MPRGTMRREAGAFALAVAILVSAPPGAAVAGDWEVEIYGGGLLTVTPSGGRATSPPRGEPFATVAPGVSSRRVTSWYFGDGGALIERRETGTNPVVWAPNLVVRPVDLVLSSSSVGWSLRGGAGLRLGRRLGSRLTAELDVEYGRHDPSFSETALAQIEDGRASFENAWSGTLSSIPGSRVTSRATVVQGSGHQVVAIGVLNVNLQTGDAPKWSRRPPRRRFVSYVSFGAGLVSTRGDEASATLVGRYQFASPAGESVAPFEETDTVTVRSRTFGTSFVGVVGAGWKQDISTRWGVRFDARAYLSRNPTRIVMDAQPSVTTGRPASALVIDSKIGAIQFVNDSSAYEGQRSSLSGPAVRDFVTFSGTGIQMQFNVTLGVFLRL
jgi:hypothetical protein